MIPTGRFAVRRVSGLLPWGVTKRLGEREGATYVFGLRFGAFDIEGNRFVYRWWPIVDVLEQDARGVWQGRGTAFGLTFCHFRLEPL